MINAMTVDVEDYFHVSAFARRIDRRDWDSYPLRVGNNTARLLDILSQYDVRATFFTLGWVAERDPALIKRIAAAGHEIACHGYSHELVYRQTPAVFRQETEHAKKILEDLVQMPIAGYRAASYSITAASLWALDVLCELGFTYDSSVFPVRHDRYGIPGARREPHRLRTPAGNSIIEFPLSTIELLRYRLPVSGGGYFRLFPYAVTRAALRHINDREHNPVIFYLHPWEIDPNQPRVEAGWLSRFRHYNNLEKCEARLHRLLKDFRFGRVGDALAPLGLRLPAPIDVDTVALSG
jgi:polysaccharide deacetylase family protein (PEP-CTERM system associated)